MVPVVKRLAVWFVPILCIIGLLNLVLASTYFKQGTVIPTVPQPRGFATTAAGRKKPRITALMLTYNRHYFLKRVIDQVRQQVRPDGYDLELVLVDDSLKMPPPELLESNSTEGFFIKYIFIPEHVSLGHKRNVGLDLSEGDVVIHFDDDDLVSRHRLKAQIEPILSGEADLTVPHFKWTVHIREPLRPWQSPMALAHGMMAYRRSFLEAHKCRFEDTNIGEDDLMIHCVMFSGGRLFSVHETNAMIYVLKHGANIWNTGMQNPTEQDAVKPPSALFLLSERYDLQKEFAELITAEDDRNFKPDPRPPAYGLTWHYDDAARPWWWLRFGDMPNTGKWPILKSENGCPRAYAERMLRKDSGTTVSDDSEEGCSPAIGGFNGTHCLECSACHFFDGKQCQLCQRCGIQQWSVKEWFANGFELQVEVEKCGPRSDAICEKLKHTPYNVPTAHAYTGMQCGPYGKGNDGEFGMCPMKQSMQCCSKFGFCGASESHCACPECINYRQVPWGPNGECGIHNLCSPYSARPCCNTTSGMCIATQSGEGKYVCWDPRSYYALARKMRLPIWESQPSESQAFNNYVGVNSPSIPWWPFTWWG